MAEPFPLPSTLEPGPSERGFRIGLYLEHLEEAASMWEQRPADRLNPDLAWFDLEDDESRLELHLDALVLGGDLALAVCRQRALEGDAGELHAALRVFCRQGRSDLVGVAMEGIDLEDEEALDALSDALVAELPSDWEAGALRPDRLDDPRRLRVATDLIIHRALEGHGALLGALPSATGPHRARIVRAVGRSSGIDLRPFLDDLEADVRLEAAIALLKRHTSDATMTVLQATRTDPALVRTLALAGRETAVPWLLDVLKHPPTALDAADTLGLMGDPAAIPALIVALEGDAADAAARALYVLTGADLEVETFVEDILEDDELFEDEREALARGEAITPPGQAPRGTTVVGPSTDPAVWQAWWDQHRDAFLGTDRFRFGQPAGPVSQVTSLEAPFVPHRLRRWIADELEVRYRMHIAFDPMWSVARQRAALEVMHKWAAAQHVVPGRWYVSGHYAS